MSQHRWTEERYRDTMPAQDRLRPRSAPRIASHTRWSSVSRSSRSLPVYEAARSSSPVRKARLRSGRHAKAEGRAGRGQVHQLPPLTHDRLHRVSQRCVASLTRRSQQPCRCQPGRVARCAAPAVSFVPDLQTRSSARDAEHCSAPRHSALVRRDLGSLGLEPPAGVIGGVGALVTAWYSHRVQVLLGNHGRPVRLHARAFPR